MTDEQQDRWREDYNAEALRSRTQDRMEQGGIPAGTDDPILLALGAQSLPGSVQRSEQTIQEALAEAEDAMIKYLVTKSQELQADGCCSGPEWRKHLCQYHQGYADGVSVMYERAFGPL
jgi:hypothetical protein